MAEIVVTALYDNGLNYFGPNGKLFSIDLLTPIFGDTQMPATLVPEDNTTGIQMVTLLKANTTPFGMLYLNMTQDQYNALIAAAQQLPSLPEITETITIDADTNTISSTSWVGATFTNIAVDGITVDLRNLTFNQIDGSLSIYFNSGLVAEQWVQVTYHL